MKSLFLTLILGVALYVTSLGVGVLVANDASYAASLSMPAAAPAAKRASAGASLADTARAPALAVPVVPPDQDACASGWQTGRRISGVDAVAAYVIDTQFDQLTGAGRLLRYRLDRQAGRSGRGGDGNGDNQATSASLSAPVWDAGKLMDLGQPPATARRIFTSNTSGAAVEFTWQALDPIQRAKLDIGADGLGEARLDYLRGERSCEGAPFRIRASLLGQFVRSVPLLVGSPSPVGQGADYAAFYQQYRDRQKLVYAGANDGMLHAFGWDDGIERFAYIPAALLPALPQLAVAGGTPRAYVDGSPERAEVLVGSQWRTVLASGMGMGARGVFALDITDPAADPRPLWEFTEADDTAIGFIHAPPRIVKVRTGGRGQASFRYFALVSSGLDPADNGGDSALFLLAFDKAPGAPWRRGDNYFRLSVPNGQGDARRVLAPPALVLAQDGSVHNVYAGDSNGVMWRFELDGLDRSGLTGKEQATVAALFQARAADGGPQAITAAARVVFAPGGGYLVLFGTGQTLVASDLERAGFFQQTFYAVRDSDRRPMQRVAGRSALAERRLREASGAFSLTGEGFDYNGAGTGVKQGWYVDFPRAIDDGERLAGPVQLSNTAAVIFSAAPGNTRCAPVLRAYIVDSVTGLGFARHGLASDGAVTGRRVDAGMGNKSGGASLPPVLLALGGGHDPATPTGASRTWASLGLFQPMPGEITVQLDKVEVSTLAGRLSWREIANWPELHDAAIKPLP